MTTKAPVHPGRIVTSALDDLDLSVTDAAVLNVGRPPDVVQPDQRPRRHLPEMTGRHSKAVGGTPGFWLRLQMNYELAEIEQRADTIEVNPLPARSA